MRFDQLEAEFEHQVHRGDATELFVLERAGIKRPPDVVVAVTGDDEDNIVICQLARDRYGVETTIARVNDPRNQPYFDLLGITPTVSATASIMGLIEHEVPEHGLIHLLELRKENLEIVEILDRPERRLRRQVDPRGRAARGLARDLDRPQRQGRGARRRDAARAGRLGARDPRARQGRRAAQGPRPPVVRLALAARGRRARCAVLAAAAGARRAPAAAPTGRWFGLHAGPPQQRARRRPGSRARTSASSGASR